MIQYVNGTRGVIQALVLYNSSGLGNGLRYILDQRRL